MKTMRWMLLVVLVVVLAACGGRDSAATTPGATTPDATPPDSTVTVVAPTEAPIPTLVPTEPPSPTTPAAATSTPEATVTPNATEPAEETATAEEGVAVRGDLAGKIAFVRGKDTWLYLPRSGEVRQLLADTTDVRWSPDGRAIAFARADGLYLADGEGANERQLHAASRINTPVWSPDGSRLAFEIGTLADEPAAREVWVFDLATNEARRIARGADPAWAPDGKRIAYVTGRGGEGVRRNQLRLVNWRGDNDWPVVTDLPPELPPIGVPGSQPGRDSLEHMMADPVWDADGRYIYVPSFVIYQVLTDFFIWERADATNGGSTFIGELPGGSATPSPDRRAVLFGASSARGDSWFVARALPPEGTPSDGDWQWAETPQGDTSVSPAWAPDGQAVAYYRCALDAPDWCSLELLTPEGGATLIPNVFGGAAPDFSVPLALSWGRDG